MSLRLNYISMLPILILNQEKLNTQVLVTTKKLEDDTWAFTLNNTTKNIYKIFLESYFSESTGKVIFKETSSEFKLHPGIATVTEKEIGDIISRHKNECAFACFINSMEDKDNSSGNIFRLSVFVKQKYGPELGYQKIVVNY